jgi:hypothetical protein
MLTAPDRIAIRVAAPTGSRSLRTPNGIRTRAATLKGWRDSSSGPSESTDQRAVRTTLAAEDFTSGIPWALTLSTA